jgi:amidase
LTLSDDLISSGVAALGRRIRARDVSCREVMVETLSRIEQLNPRFNAIVSLRDGDAVLAEANAADADLARGLWRGPLHGVPQAVKDLAPTKGLRTTWGSRIYENFVPEADAIHVERARAAGAILIGKTNVPEWGLGSHTVNPVFGATKNAFRPELSAGGSSGGGAVALALGLLSVADGSDTGGSLRNPAAWANVFGLRPSFGRVPSGGPDDVFVQQLGTAGPMGVTVEDVATLLAVQAGRDPRAPLSLGEAFEATEALPAQVRNLRIGVIGDWNGHMAFEPGVLDLCDAALRRFEAMGAIVERATPAFDPHRLWESWIRLRQWAVGSRQKAHYLDPAKRELLPPQVIYEVEGAMRLSALEVYEASAARSDFYRAVLALFERFDVLALPAAQVFPFPIEWDWPREVGGRAMDTYHRWMEVMIGPTMAGCPAISVPAGLDASRPMGLQLWGPPRADAAVLRLAAAYETAHPGICHARPAPA